MSKSNAMVLVALLVAAALSTTAVPASAASSHCVVLLVPSSIEASGAILAKEVDLGCYPTYAEALAAGSSGAIDVPDGTTPASLTDAVLAADTVASATADVLIGHRVPRHQLWRDVEELLRDGDLFRRGSVGRRRRRRLVGRPVQFGEGFRGMRHEQEVREPELRRVRAHLHPELHELRDAFEPGVLVALETLRGRVRR